MGGALVGPCRVWLEEYDQSIKYMQKHQHILPAQQANKPTQKNPVVDKRSFLERKPQ